jgi:hypothetical protein
MKPLTAAVQRGAYDSLQVLCQLPAVQQLRCPDVLQLLQLVAKGQGRGICAELLFKLPAAQQLSMEEVRVLLNAAGVFGDRVCLECIRGLPAAQQLIGEWWLEP